MLISALFLIGLIIVGFQTMARTIIRTNVAGNGRVNNVLANSRFQFADTPGPQGAILIRVSVTSDVAQNQYEISADKDFVALEDAVSSVNPPLLDSNPGQEFMVEPGTQINIDLINNNVAAQNFHTLVEFVPV